MGSRISSTITSTLDTAQAGSGDAWICQGSIAVWRMTWGTNTHTTTDGEGNAR